MTHQPTTINKSRAALSHCDGCDKARKDVRACGRDANGDPDAPDMCFLCRVEAGRGRYFSRKTGRYDFPEYDQDVWP